jgi:hypothetical protein
MENDLNVAHYISELLFKHDCVIVPGFGGFVSTYSPAKVHPAQHTFTPPSKQIVFNKHLQQNDGLLANTISESIPCSFDVAMSGVTKFVEDINSKLKVGKKVELHNLGTLSLDPEKNIAFETFPEINFLIDSFGLASFQSMPVIREVVTEKRKPVERIDRPVADEIIESKPVRNRTRRVLVTSAVITPVLVAAFWLSTQTPNGFAGFTNFFGKKEVSKFQPVKWFSKGSSDTLKMITELKADANGIAKISLAENAPEIIVDIHKVVPDATSVAHENWNSKSYNGTRYYIIGGCFENQENVIRFISSLKGKGFDPQVIDQVRSRLTHIGIASFASKEEAVQYLAKISGDVPGAWILKK